MHLPAFTLYFQQFSKWYSLVARQLLFCPPLLNLIDTFQLEVFLHNLLFFLLNTIAALFKTLLWSHLYFLLLSSWIGKRNVFLYCFRQRKNFNSTLIWNCIHQGTLTYQECPVSSHFCILKECLQRDGN